MATERKHASLSPSASHRWLECTPSAMLEAALPEEPSSDYAEEGTEAHLLSAIKLSYMLGKTNAAQYSAEFDTFIMRSRFYNPEFNDYVNSYCQEVMDIIKVDYENETVEVHLEAEVHYDDVVPGGYGISDVVIIGKNFVHIVDLKFGKGVPVTAIDNPQLRLYALAAMRTFRLKSIYTYARMTIVQPRLYDKSTDNMAVMDLNNWAETYVKPRADLASRGEGKFVPGDHCKFCKLKSTCEALAEAQLKTAKEEFELAVVDEADAPSILAPHQMSPEMLSRILTIAPKFQDWFKDVAAYATSAMINDELKIPGYKIVRGRSKRLITDHEKVAEVLRTNGYLAEDYLKPAELLGITKLEKNVGKKVIEHLVGDYIIKPPGKPTITSDSDPREAIDSSAFKLIGQEFDVDED